MSYGKILIVAATFSLIGVSSSVAQVAECLCTVKTSSEEWDRPGIGPNIIIFHSKERELNRFIAIDTLQNNEKIRRTWIGPKGWVEVHSYRAEQVGATAWVLERFLECPRIRACTDQEQSQDSRHFTDRPSPPSK
jgi:hypothetical protein